jgi:hypothetical protein
LALQLSVGTFSDDPMLRGTFVKPESFTLVSKPDFTATVQLIERGKTPRLGIIAESADSCSIQIEFDRQSYRINGYAAPDDSRPFSYQSEPGKAEIHFREKGALVIKFQRLNQLSTEPVRVSFSRNNEFVSQNFIF